MTIAVLEKGKRMSQYIKADELRHTLEHQPCRFDKEAWISKQIVLDVIDRTDGIFITECDKCMEWHPREATDYGFCIRWGQYTKESDYCSYGK